jgi:hypothetical protein
MGLNDVHNVLFNAHILYSVILGVWSALFAFRNQSISGGFWGALASITILAAVVLLIGILMTVQGLRPPRMTTYYIYMAWLVVIMPGLFTLLRGRDDRSAAVAFSILSFFNAATSFSMLDRSVVGPWTLDAA